MQNINNLSSSQICALAINSHVLQMEQGELTRTPEHIGSRAQVPTKALRTSALSLLLWLSHRPASCSLASHPGGSTSRSFAGEGSKAPHQHGPPCALAGPPARSDANPTSTLFAKILTCACAVGRTHFFVSLLFPFLFFFSFKQSMLRAPSEGFLSPFPKAPGLSSLTRN